MLDLSNIKKVHFVGISSPFSSFCAQKLLDRGINVTGSELHQNNSNAQYWIDKKVLYPEGHDAKYVTPDLDMVIFPNRPLLNNPECLRAQELNLHIVDLPELVGAVSQDMQVIAVAGTHGKSTTTAIMAWCLYVLDGDANFLLGGAEDKLFGLNINWRSSSIQKKLVIEACEYKRQFLRRAPNPFISVITHIDLDHTDFYKSQEDYNMAFADFIFNTQDACIMDAEQKNERNVQELLIARSSQVPIINVAGYRKRLKFENPHLKGKYNFENALRVFVTLLHLGYSEVDILRGLESFPGLALRFELVGETSKGAKVFKDYAHNPEKIKACIHTAREAYPDKRIVLVFQPHSVERTFTFKDAYSDVLGDANALIITNIFSPTGEAAQSKLLINGDEFYNYIRARNSDKMIEYIGALDELPGCISRYNNSDHIIVLASAGDLYKSVKDILSL